MASLTANLENADVFEKRSVLLINHSKGLGRKWWDDIGRRFVDPEFARLVDELLANAEPDDTYERMATWADE